MEKEIDIRALLMDKLIPDYEVADCNSFRDNSKDDEGIFGEQLVFRNFNEEMWWSKARQTSFIESIFMGFELPLIVVFEISQNPIKYLVVDDLNRIRTIQNFLNDELRLVPKSIKKAKFLENKTFSELTGDAKEYFRGRGIQVLKYLYSDKSRTLRDEEIEEIAKQMYLRYNSGIKLKNEEIQKADYEDDIVTKKIAFLLNNKEFVNKLSSIYFTPQKVSKTFNESTLMYCRLAITSCYAPVFSFCTHKSILDRIDLFYRDYTAEVKKETIVDNFKNIVSCLYELTQQEYFKKHSKLHNQNFMLVTYWLIFYIKKFNLIELNQFNWRHYMNYFGNREEKEPLFSIYHVNAKDRYNAVIDYMANYYGIDLKEYVPNEKEKSSLEKVDSFEKLPKYNFLLTRDAITVTSLINTLNKNCYILRPSYQRREINDIKASSFLIESLILNMAIPDILVYKRNGINGKTIFEVMDGQQRCFSLLAYLKKRYKNFDNEIIASEKEGFKLKGLTLCQNLNNKSIDSDRKDFILDSRYAEKIRNGKIRIAYIPEDENPYFSAKDYFTNINKTIIPLKKTSYRYWKVCYDSKILKKAEKISKKFEETLLPKSDYRYLPQQFVINLAYLFSHNSTYDKGFSTIQVSNWLNDFNMKKYKLMNDAKDDEVNDIRSEYIKYLDMTEVFLTKLQNWLTTENKTIFEIIAKKNKQVSFTDLLCLYYLIGDINQADLINNSSNIYEIVFEFFESSLNNKLKRSDKISNIGKYKDRLSFFTARTIEINYFKDKLTDLILE